MLFRLAATLPLEDLYQPEFLKAYAIGSGVLYALVIAVALLRRVSWAEASFEAHTAGRWRGSNGSFRTG